MENVSNDLRFRYLAQNYIFRGKPFAEICEHNAAVAQAGTEKVKERGKEREERVESAEPEESEEETDGEEKEREKERKGERQTGRGRKSEDREEERVQKREKRIEMLRDDNKRKRLLSSSFLFFVPVERFQIAQTWQVLRLLYDQPTPLPPSTPLQTTSSSGIKPSLTPSNSQKKLNAVRSERPTRYDVC